MKCRYVNDWGDECGNDALDYGWCPFHLKQMYGKPLTVPATEPGSVDLRSGGSSAYYDLPQGAKKLQDVIVEKGMCYSRGNIFKAAYRWDEKGISDDPIENKIYNLEKIIWFAQDLLDRAYAQHPDNPRGVNYERDGPEGD